jgi:hypothetical protein
MDQLPAKWAKEKERLLIAVLTERRTQKKLR